MQNLTLYFDNDKQLVSISMKDTYNTVCLDFWEIEQEELEKMTFGEFLKESFRYFKENKEV